MGPFTPPPHQDAVGKEPAPPCRALPALADSLEMWDRRMAGKVRALRWTVKRAGGPIQERNDLGAKATLAPLGHRLARPWRPES